MISAVVLQDLVAKHIKIDKGGSMNNYNYDLNTLYNDNTYDELLECYNNINVLNEGVLKMPLNKIKDMLKKITTIKNDEQMEKFVNKNKKFVKSNKELKQQTMKIAKQLNFGEKEVKEAEIDIIKALAAISQFSVLTVALGIPILLVMLVNTRIKKQKLSDISTQVAKDIKISIQQAKKGPYTSSLKFTVYGALFAIASGVLYTLSVLTIGLASAVFMSFGGGAFIAALVLLILSSISFMWTFLGTPGRMMRGEV